MQALAPATREPEKRQLPIMELMYRLNQMPADADSLLLSPPHWSWLGKHIDIRNTIHLGK